MAAEDVFGIVGTTQAGNFHVERVVAEGGFGVVYRAQHGGFRAPVALKCLKVPDDLSKHQRSVFLEKFREEAELMFRLSAAITEVVRPLHVDVLQLADGRFVPFIALEWLEGESLDEIITRRHAQGQAPIGLHKLVKMLRPVAHALSRAHRFPGPNGTVSIIHRDLKPENIFVATIGGSESIKILDFGIAKAKTAASQAAGRITGRAVDDDESASFTPAYGAPEQWVPKRFGETGTWTDVWGLALSMVEALSGTPPIDGDTYTMRRVVLDERKRPTPQTLGVLVPDEVERVFQRALALDPKQRTKDLEAFWSELESAMGLAPSFGSRDLRREGDASVHRTEVISAPRDPPRDRSKEGPPSPGMKLARIELARSTRASAPDLPPSGKRPPLPSTGAAGRPITGEHAPISARSADLEFELPIGGDPEPPSARAPRTAPATSTPIASPPIASPPAPSPRRAPMPSALEADLPSMEAPDEPPREPAPAPAAKPKAGLGDLELSLPSRSFETSPESARTQQAPQGSAAFGGGPGRPTSPSAPGVSPRGFDLTPAQRAYDPGAIAEDRGDTHASQRGRLRAPVQILVLALVLSLAEIGYSRVTGNVLMLGPIRPFWITAPLAAFGLAFTIWRLIESGGEHR